MCTGLRNKEKKGGDTEKQRQVKGDGNGYGKWDTEIQGRYGNDDEGLSSVFVPTHSLNRRPVKKKKRQLTNNKIL